MKLWVRKNQLQGYDIRKKQENRLLSSVLYNSNEAQQTLKYLKL